jgi:hypothetical protein
VCKRPIGNDINEMRHVTSVQAGNQNGESKKVFYIVGQKIGAKATTTFQNCLKNSH